MHIVCTSYKVAYTSHGCTVRVTVCACVCMRVCLSLSISQQLLQVKVWLTSAEGYKFN